MEFIESRRFTRRLHELAGDAADELLRAIESDLEQNPDRGALVPGLAGIRKARVGNPGRGKGKRGGFRYLYVYFRGDEQIGLLYLFDKDEQHAFARSCTVHERGEHGLRRFGKLLLCGHVGTQIRERFHRAQQPPEIFFLVRHPNFGATNTRAA